MNFYEFVHEAKTVYIDPGETDGTMKAGLRPVTMETRERESGVDYVQNFKHNVGNELKHEDHNSTESEKKSLLDLESTLPGSLADINELSSEKIHIVKEKYYEDKEKLPTNLVIEEFKEKIITLVENNEVIILTGPTGCGKTTQVPQFLLDASIKKGKYCNIVVTQPRRIAAISIAKRISEERGWRLGSLCGFRVGLMNCTSGDTLLTYMTVGILLQSLISKKNFHNYTHIILDEVHERDQSMDFILIVIKKLLRSSTLNNVKIILMSATVGAEKFSEFFQRYYCGKLIPPPILNITPRTNYPVKIFYLDDLSGLGDIPNSHSEPKIAHEIYEVCLRLIKRFDKFPGEAEKKNSVLIFLPGMYEIDYLYTKLMDSKTKSQGEIEYKWIPLPLHSSITSEEQSRVFLPVPSNFRKIILSTNIAESSITIPDIKFVIDFCLMKSLRNDPFSNFSSIQLCWASKTSCKQRAGRVGRMMEGQVYRMVKKEFYEEFDEESLPEILTMPLEKIVLQAKMLNMGEPRAVLAIALDPPDLGNIEGAILLLKEIGGLLKTRKGVYTPYDGDLTFLGYLMVLLPVDIRITRLIVLGYIFGCLRECIIMGAALSVKSVFNYPFKDKLEAYNSKLAWADGSCCDCIAFLNVYEVWCNNVKSGYFQRSKGDNEFAWAKRYFIQLRLLKEVKLLVEEITSRLEGKLEEPIGLGNIIWEEHQKALVLKIIIAGAFYPNYFGRGRQGSKENEENAVKVLGGRDPFTTVVLHNFPSEQPIELYVRELKEKLSSCLEEMKITSDRSSKVYVEFLKHDLKVEHGKIPFDEIVPGKISMGVYRAIKMGRLQKSINIKVLPIEKAKKLAESLGIKRQTNLLNEDINNSLDERIFSSTLPGIDVSQICFIITHFIDPGHFWACLYENSEIQNKIFCILNKKKEKLKSLNEMPAAGNLVIAPFEENGDSYFYRAKVQCVSRKGPEPCVKVFFIDYGNTAVVNLGELKAITPELKNLIDGIPAQAFECVLCKIRPSLVMNPKGSWSDKARTAFENIIKNEGKLVGKIYSVVNGVVSLKLFKASRMDCNINKLLVEEGYAEYVEENYLSKFNHELRKEKGLDAKQKNAYSNLQRRELFNSTSLKLPPSEDFSVNVELRGPYSPLEMKLYPYVRSAIGKTVSISSESVNSVLLDNDPQDPHERLVVAGFVHQNRDKSSVLLNTTTLMPNIHGLASIVSFLFAPMVELKMNRKRTRCIGILCGLGKESNDAPIYPEHDFEIYFDCAITMKDLKIINKLRYFMSLLLMTEDDSLVPRLSRSEIIKIQKEIQVDLLKLFSKQRKAKEVELYGEPYKWNKINNAYLGTKSIASKLYNASIFPFVPEVLSDKSTN